jgi:hypothetical protein
VCFALVIGRSPICAAGVTWTSRTTSAPWAARAYHTSVIDAAGTVYIISGDSGSGTFYNDVWVSTDGGADQTRVGGTRLVLAGTRGVLCGTQGCSMVLYGYSVGSCPGTSGLLEGYSDGASGILHARKRAKLEGCASALEGVLCGVPFAEGGLGAIFYCGALDGLFMALQGVLCGTQGVLRGTLGTQGVR